MLEIRAALRDGLAALPVALTPTQFECLLQYLALIQKWTRVYNLTSVREPAQMLTHHLLDSLAVIGPLRRQVEALGRPVARADGCDDQPIRLLDVGSGAGLPGVVIAICCPAITVDCVDSVAKKAAFVQQVAISVGLPNLRGVHARAESLRDKYDVVSARAFSSLADLVRLSDHALAEHGLWLAMKGEYPADEVAALPSAVQVFHVEHLVVPGLDAKRCIVWLRRAPLV